MIAFGLRRSIFQSGLEVHNVMSEGGEPKLQVTTTPDLETWRPAAHEIAVIMNRATQEEKQTQSVVVDQGTESSSVATGGSATITQNHITSAKAILDEIDEIGEGQILVVPSSTPMQSGNSAICIGSLAQVDLYKQAVDVRKSSYEKSVDVDSWMKKLAVDTILVSESVFGMTAIKQRGVIYHEFGHTFLGRSETAAVFAHELNCLLKKFPKDEVIGWVNEARGGGKYYDSYAHDPGLRELTDGSA